MRKLIWGISVFLVGCGTNEVENNEHEIVEVVDTVAVVQKSELQVLEDEILSNPESPNGYYKRAEYYKNHYRFGLAIDDINRAIKLAPDAASLTYAKAEILYAQALYQGDIAILDQAEIYLNYTLEQDSSNQDALLLLAEYLAAKGETDNAMIHVNRAMKMNEFLPRPYFVKGKIYEALGNFDLAESSYQTAIELDANYYQAMVQLGWLYAQQQNDLALTYYDNAIAIHPTSLEAHRNKGLYHHFAGNYTVARESFFKMLEIDSTFEEAYFNLGNTYVGVYRDDMPKYSKDTTIDRAIEYFQRAVDLNPGYVQALYNMALGYQLKGNKEKAEELYRFILDIETNYQPAIDGLNSL